jgi:catechol 2,3-dioxygenase-like lactoylglutathione lyase family enzyme
MIARALSHVSFPVRDLERSLRFYRDVLGLVPVPRPDFGFPGAWLAAGDAQVHLIEVTDDVPVGAPPPTLNPLAGHTAFAVTDYAAAVAALEAAGLEILPTNAEMGQLWVKDPDGHVIELISVQR